MKFIQEIAIHHVKKNLANEILKSSQDFYRSRYFLIKKKNKKIEEYRFINDVQLFNEIIIHDFDILSSMNEFSKDFAGYSIISSIDYYFNYYQIPLNRRFKDLTTFLMKLDLVRFIRLSQG